MKPHIIQAQHYWKNFIKPGDTIIDATIGNGHDTLYLAHLLQGKGSLIGYDIQSEAITETKKRLGFHYGDLVTLKLQSHAYFDEKDVKLIVYNLGYLPGGDKTVTTQRDSTLQSIQNGLKCLSSDGAISITCYPGHEEGAKERDALLDFLKNLAKGRWSVCHHVWINRPLSPSLIWLQSSPDA